MPIATTHGNQLRVVKSTPEELVVENHIILFGGRDLDQEYFDGSTDVESDYTRTVGRLAIDFEHGFEPDWEAAPEGEQAPGRDDILGYTDWSTAKKTDLGWLVQSVLDRRNRYVEAFGPLIEAGLVGTSSEAVPEGVERTEDGHLRRWPLKRNSLTVTPAEPKMLGENALQAIKHLCELSPQFAKTIAPVIQAAQDTATGDDAPPAAGPVSVQSVTTYEEPSMSGEQPAEGAIDVKSFDDLSTQVGQLTKAVDRILDYLENDPKATAAGVVAPGGEDYPRNKSLGDFLLAVRFGDMKRIREVYQTDIDAKAFKDQSGTSGAAAGVLVPEEYTAELLQIGNMASPLLQGVRTIPVGTDHGVFPALDNYTAPAAGTGQTAAAAGIKVGNVPAGTELPETEAKFKQLRWLVSKAGGVTEVENELMNDSPMAMEALLRGLFAIAIVAKNERNVIRGSGVGEPLGILNAPCAVAVAPDTNNIFAYEDALEMKAHFKSFGGRGVWIMHNGMWMDIGVMESAAGGAVYQANYQAPIGQGGLLGYGIMESEHSPQADTSGCVILADLSSYLLFMRQYLAVAFSEHAAFKQDKGVWRFVQRNDGKPWLLGKIILADPTGNYEVSPFVYFND